MNFPCKNCGESIFVKFLKPGEIAKCKFCGVDCEVPDDTIESSSEQVKQLLRPDDQRKEMTETSHTDPVNVWIYRILAVNFFGGAVFGSTSIAEALFSGEIPAVSAFFVLFFLAFFVWNFVLGVALLEKHPKSLKWARTTFIFLVPHFSSPAFSYFIDSGLTVKTLFLFTSRGLTLMWTWAGGFDFGINQSGKPLVVGVNVIAVLALIFFYVLSRSEKHNDEPTETSD